MSKKSEPEPTRPLAFLFSQGSPEPALWNRASAKIGWTSIEKLRWLLEFAERRDAAEFPDDLALEALCFMVHQGLFIEWAKARRFASQVFWDLAKAVSNGLEHLLDGTDWKIVA